MNEVLRLVIIENRHLIIKVALLNSGLTLLSECISRSILGIADPALWIYSSEFGINGQSLISVLSTFFITILGAPAWYIHSRKKRYITFVILGLFVSIISQLLSHQLLKGSFSLSIERLCFDIFYLLSLKYLFFEWKRKIISCNSSSNRALLMARVQQDTSSAIVKNVLLALIGLKN